MHPRAFAMYGGILMLVIGAVALIPQMVGSSETLPPLIVQDSYGLFLNTFPMNIFNKIVLIAFGLGGILAAIPSGRELPRTIMYSRITFVVMGVLALLGLSATSNTLGGYWPLFGADAAFHAVFAVLGAYFGFALSARTPKDRAGAHPTRESLAH